MTSWGELVPHGSSGLRREIRPLTSLRWIAALWVFVQHAIYRSLDARGLEPSALHDKLMLGFGGVTFFFVLSGFIMAYVYGHHMRAPTLHATLRFYASRVARIWPLHLLLTVVALLLLARSIPDTPGDYVAFSLAHALLVQCWVPIAGTGFCQSLNSPAWSLSSELFFYATFPLTGWLVLHVLRAHAWRVLGAIGVAWAGLLAFSQVFHADPNISWIVQNYPPVRLLDFVLGIVLFALIERHLNPPSRSQPRLATGVGLWTLAEAAACASVVGMVAVSNRVPDPWLLGPWYLPAVTLVVAVFALERGLLARVFSLRPARYLGEISYAFYLTHLLVLEYVYNVLDLHERISVWPLSLLALAATMLLSSLLFHAIETPMRKRLRGRWNAAIDRRCNP